MSEITQVSVDGVVVAETTRIDISGEPQNPDAGRGLVGSVEVSVVVAALKCEGSGRIVPDRVVGNAIYTEQGWIARCPACGRPTTFSIADLKPDNSPGVTRYPYRRRWDLHSKERA